MWVLIAAAFAGDMRPGLLYPGAGELDASAKVGAGAATLSYPWGPTVYAGVNAEVAVGRVGLFGDAGYLRYGSDPVEVAGRLGARVQAVRSQWFNLAPWVGSGGVSTLTDFAEGTLEVGAAIEGGGDHVRYDFSAPLLRVFAQANGTPRAEFGLVWGETGVRGVFGHHSIRLGLTALYRPSATWRYEADHWFVEAGMLAVIPIATPAIGGAVRAGARF